MEKRLVMSKYASIHLNLLRLPNDENYRCITDKDASHFFSLKVDLEMK